jgi:hypothetical protein
MNDSMTRCAAAEGRPATTPLLADRLAVGLLALVEWRQHNRDGWLSGGAIAVATGLDARGCRPVQMSPASRSPR